MLCKSAGQSFLQISHSDCASLSPFFYISSSGTPINKRPVLGYRNLNLFKLYRLVHKLGGFDNVSTASAAAPLQLVHFGHTFFV